RDRQEPRGRPAQPPERAQLPHGPRAHPHRSGLSRYHPGRGVRRHPAARLLPSVERGPHLGDMAQGAFGGGSPMPPQDTAIQRLLLRAEVEDFYYAEAALLDGRRYDEWLRLFTDDTRYWIPTRQNRMLRELEGETSDDDGTAFADDDRWSL